MFHIAHTNRVHLLTMALWFSSVPEMQAVKRHEFDSCYDDGQSHVSTDSEEAVMQTQLSKLDTSSHASKAVAEDIFNVSTPKACAREEAQYACKAEECLCKMMFNQKRVLTCNRCFPNDIGGRMGAIENEKPTERIAAGGYCCIQGTAYQSLCQNGVYQCQVFCFDDASTAHIPNYARSCEACLKEKGTCEGDCMLVNGACIKKDAPPPEAADESNQKDAQPKAPTATQPEEQKPKEEKLTKRQQEQAEEEAILKAAGLKFWEKQILRKRPDQLTPADTEHIMGIYSKYDAGKEKVEAEKAAAAAATEADGSCFGGESRLRLANGSTIPLSLAEKGMNIWTGQKQGLITEVLVHAVGRVVEVALLQTPEGELLAEPNHPVLLGGQWLEIDDALHSGLLHNSSPTLERRFVERFYNLEIDGHMMDGSLHSYMVNGFVVSGLGDNEELNLRFPRQHVWKDKAVQSATEIV